MSTLTHTGSHPVLGCIETIGEALDEVASVEPVFMTTKEKQTALVEITKLSSRVESLKLRVLAAADDIAVETGARSTASWLADTTRDNHGTVLRSARLAAAVDDRYRHVATALAEGRVNVAQAHVIVTALDDLPTDLDPALRMQGEKHLVEQSDEFGPRELRRLGDRLLEAIAPDIADQAEYERLVAEERRAHAATKLTFKPRGDGSTDLFSRIPDHVANRLRTYLDSFTSPRRAAALGEVDALPVARRRGEAFCALLENLPDSGLPHHGGTATSVLVTLDYDTLLNDPGVGHHLHRRPDHRRTGPPARLPSPNHPRRPRRQGRDPRPRPQTAALRGPDPHRPQPALPRMHHHRLHDPRRLVRSPPQGPLVLRRQDPPPRRHPALLLPPPPRPRPRLDRPPPPQRHHHLHQAHVRTSTSPTLVWRRAAPLALSTRSVRPEPTRGTLTACISLCSCA